MSEVRRILDQLQRAYEGDAWHGPPLRTILAGVSAATAAAHPISGAHSIAEIVLHLCAWHDAAARRLAGQHYEPAPEVNFPIITSLSDAAWNDALRALQRSYEALRDQIAGLDDVRLDEAIAGQKYTAYVLIHGVVQHDLYHAGQIALLKKLLAGSS